jgi:hypothetical protein
MRKVPRKVRSSDQESEVPTNIKMVSRGLFVGTNMILPRNVGSSDLVSGVPTYTFQLQKDRFLIRINLEILRDMACRHMRQLDA